MWLIIVSSALTLRRYDAYLIGEVVVEYQLFYKMYSLCSLALSLVQ